MAASLKLNGNAGHANGFASNAGPVIPIANRLKEGRALAEDVWSIYKFVTQKVKDCGV